MTKKDEKHSYLVCWLLVLLIYFCADEVPIPDTPYSYLYIFNWIVNSSAAIILLRLKAQIATSKILIGTYIFGIAVQAMGLIAEARNMVDFYNSFFYPTLEAILFFQVLVLMWGYGNYRRNTRRNRFNRDDLYNLRSIDCTPQACEISDKVKK